MSDKPRHLRPVPDLPSEEEQPSVREDGVIQGVPGPLPSIGEHPTIGETIPPMPTEESGIPPDIKHFDDPNEEEASVRNHPSNLPEPPLE